MGRAANGHGYSQETSDRAHLQRAEPERGWLAAGLDQTSARDGIKRKLECFEYLEKLCERGGISWEWLRFGNGEMETSEKPSPQPQAPNQAPAPKTTAIYRPRFVAAMEASYRLIGGSDSQASTLAALVLSVAQGRKAHDTAPAPQASVIDRTRLVAAMEASYRLIGAPDSQASTLAALVLSVAQGRKAHDTGVLLRTSRTTCLGC
jgi:hypothetical protein